MQNLVRSRLRKSECRGTAAHITHGIEAPAACHRQHATYLIGHHGFAKHLGLTSAMDH
jgi:hypothetical protein